MNLRKYNTHTQNRVVLRILISYDKSRYAPEHVSHALEHETDQLRVQFLRSGFLSPRFVRVSIYCSYERAHESVKVRKQFVLHISVLNTYRY